MVVRPPSLLAGAGTAGRAAAAAKPQEGLPYLLCLPGIEGCSTSSQRQWDELSSAFDLYILKVLSEDRTSFEGLVEVAVVRGRVIAGGVGSLGVEPALAR